MLPYLVLGLVLALAPASGEPLIQGSLSKDLDYLHEYFQKQVLPKWRDEPHVIADHPARRFCYLPGKDVFVTGAPEVRVEPGSIRMEVQLGRRIIQVARDVQGPAVVVVPGVSYYKVMALAGQYVCEVGEVILAGRPPRFAAVLKRDDQVIAREDLGELFLADVEYWVYSDRVVMRVLGFRPEGGWSRYREGEPLAITVTFDLGGGRILVDRVKVTDAALVERMRELSRSLEGPVLGSVLRTGSGVEPLFVDFEPREGDPLVRFIERVFGMYEQGASEEELREVMSEHPNVEFLFPEKGGGTTSGIPVWVLPLLPVPLAGRRDDA
ncbi:hypothetical protein [Methanopyrus kandleri]|uniref:Uncharacterized secreted protein specific for M.kandleri, MK-3 family n=1 Tax=Methanopyrus kandleri (strain AV19 / DSM 6324 / JCM 9639 / NBRC 100938) TaxID=190192 RepID=Q8TVV0_METKA|nr:hypothetical protein [Methanopyrus kandleri]AAM02501.1 Uncharacterized secreted protein specific for M.kandleri, MK-3 family [Methanopyrus kandleri AV19]